MESAKEKILLAIDFQVQSLIALEYAMFFARGTNSEIVLLHVLEASGMFGKMFKSEDEIIRINKEAQQLLDALADKLKPEFTVSTIIEYGKAYSKILEVAERIQPKFIVMGKTEDPSIAKKIVGSNTLHIIDECKFPVLSIRGKEHIMNFDTVNKNIFVPLDITKQIKEQLTAAIELGKFFKSTIKLLTILNEESAGLETHLLTSMAKAQKMVEDAGVKCHSKMIKDTANPIYRAILNYANAEDADLLIIMTQQEKNFVDFVIGSNAKAILDQSEIPVLSLIPWDEKTEHSVFKLIYDPLNVF
jgi:nucleotide-binding universal stress UspA family protein